MMSQESTMKEQKDKMLDTSADDFATPIIPKKFKRTSRKPSISKVTKSKSKKSNIKQQTLHQVVKENFQYSDVDPEHLQMALALSKSISETQNVNENEEFCNVVSKHEKVRTLLQFGFKTQRNVEPWKCKRAPAKNKNSKFRFITPILLMRTEEERESLIQSKISLILSENIQENQTDNEDFTSLDVMSEELNKIKCSECCIFQLNHKTYEDSKELFRVPDLNILNDRTKCGTLLKDWKNIPLRDHTPERVKVHEKENTVSSDVDPKDKLNIDPNHFHESMTEEQELAKCAGSDDQKRNICIAVSPDLFEDEASFHENNKSKGQYDTPIKVKKQLDLLFSQVESDQIGNVFEEDEIIAKIDNNHSEAPNSSKSGIFHYAEYETGYKNINNISSSDEEKEIGHIENKNYLNSQNKSKLVMTQIEKNYKLPVISCGEEQDSELFGHRENINFVNSQNKSISIKAQKKNYELPVINSKENQSTKMIDHREKINFINSQNKSITIETQKEKNYELPVISSDEEQNSKMVDHRENTDFINSQNKSISIKTHIEINPELPVINSDEEQDTNMIDHREKTNFNKLQNNSYIRTQKEKTYELLVISSDEEQDSDKESRKNLNTTNVDSALEYSQIHESSPILKRTSSNSIKDLSSSSNDIYNKSLDTCNKIEKISDLRINSELVENFSEKNSFTLFNHSKSFNGILQEPVESEKAFESDEDLPIINVKSISYESFSNNRNKNSLVNNTSMRSTKSLYYTENEEYRKNLDISKNIINENSICENLNESEGYFPENISQNYLFKNSVDNVSKNSDSIHKIKVNSPNLMNSNTGDSISLNLTEHIEKMLMNSYGQTNSLINECENHLGKEKTETENRRSKSTYQLSSLLKKLMKNEELIVDKNKVDSDNLSGCSKSSEDVVCISDEELNYSCAQDNQHIDHFENLAEEELKNSNYFCSTPLRKYSKSSEDIVCISDEDCKNNENIDSHKNPADAEKSKNPKHSCSTPLRKYASFSETPTRVKTPKFGRNKSESNITPNRKVIIKTENITPMANYDKMDTPVIVNELSKFGLKPLKRKRGVNLLKHIYEMTHPVVKSKKAVDGCHSIAKKLKMDEFIKDVPKMDGSRSVEPWLETILETDIIFERQRSSKIPTCQIPLQIVWHNFLVENPEIRENILLYEPLQVEIIHKTFKELGFKFHIQDLISFFDRKCITIRIAQNQKINS